MPFAARAGARPTGPAPCLGPRLGPDFAAEVLLRAGRLRFAALARILQLRLGRRKISRNRFFFRFRRAAAFKGRRVITGHGRPKTFARRGRAGCARVFGRGLSAFGRSGDIFPALAPAAAFLAAAFICPSASLPVFFTQNVFHSFAQVGAPGADLGLARAHYAENTGFGVLQNFNFKLFPRGVEITAGFLNGTVQIFALEFLEPFHTQPHSL